MGKITILPETTKNPLSLIGERAGICWGSDISSEEKNIKRGLDCIESGHGRTLEFVNVETVIDGYSARVIREWYTHLGGAPTRLQASTRYIDYSNFEYITPKSVLNKPKAEEIYKIGMADIASASEQLLKMGIPREDVAMLLPLGMTTKIVDKRNLRNLIDMSRQRMCTRAYWEYRELFDDLCGELKNYSDQWKIIVESQFKPKCEILGYCQERNSCGIMPKKKDVR